MPLMPKPPLVLEQNVAWRVRQRVEIVAGRAEVSLRDGSRTTNWTVALEDFVPYYDEVRIHASGWLTFALLFFTLAAMLISGVAASNSLCLRNNVEWTLFLAIVAPPAIIFWPAAWLYRKFSRKRMLFYSRSTGQAVLGLRSDGSDREETARFRDALLAESRDQYLRWFQDGPAPLPANIPIELERFHRLMTEGVISAEEFERKKADLLQAFIGG